MDSNPLTFRSCNYLKTLIMKKLLYLFVFIAFVSNSLAQTYKVQRINGLKMNKFWYIFTDSTVTIKQRNLEDTYLAKMVVSADDKGQQVKDYFTNLNGNKTRFRLIKPKALKNPILAIDMIDSFTNEVTQATATIKEVINN